MQTKWVETLSRSWQILIQHPKILLPKLVVAALYGLLLIWTAQNIPIFLGEKLLDAAHVQQIARVSVMSLGLSLIALIIDILVNAMYPVIVHQINSGKKVSLGKSFGEALEQAPKVIPLNIFVIVIFSLVLVPFMTIILFSKFFAGANSDLAVGIGLLGMSLLSILMFVAFYFSNTIAVIEKRGVMQSIRKSAELGKKYFTDVTGLSIVSLFLALISMYFAFSIANLGGSVVYGLAFVYMFNNANASDILIPKTATVS